MRINDRVATVPSDKFMVFKGTTFCTVCTLWHIHRLVNSEILSENSAEYTNWGMVRKIVTFGDSVTWQDGVVYPGSHTEDG